MLAYGKRIFDTNTKKCSEHHTIYTKYITTNIKRNDRQYDTQFCCYGKIKSFDTGRNARRYTTDLVELSLDSALLLHDKK